MLVLSLTWSNIQDFRPPVFSNYLTFDQDAMALVNVTEQIFTYG